MIDSAIFDLDGTLIDSMHVWTKIDVDFLTGRGIDVPGNYTADICDMTFREAADYTVRTFCLTDTPEELIEEWNRMAAVEYGQNIYLKPYAREYLERLKRSNIKLGIATSLPQVLYEPVLKLNGIYDFFDAICTVEDVTRGKEYPDLFIHTADRLKASPECCVVFEDILPAVLSARAAGMRVCAVYDDSSKEKWMDITLAAEWAIYDFRSAPLLGSPTE